MKTVIRPETEMKDSGIEWIGDIPDTWICCKQKYMISLINGRAFKDTEFEEDGEYRILRVGNLFSNPKWYSSSLELEDDKYCDNGDLLYAWSMSYGPHIWNGGKVIYHYHIWKTKLLNDLNKEFAYYYLIALSDSIKSDIHETTMSFVTMKTMNNSYMALPIDTSEQQAIANYLDETCSKIDEIIAEAKASIDEYKELKQAVIFEVVTKGLDKNVEFIDSGDEWLGKYPKSYNIGQLSMLSNIVRGGSPRPAGDPRYYGGNISFMRISDITKDDNIYVNSCENTITEEGLTRTRVIPPNTLLLTNSGATLGVPKINTFETAFNDGIAAFLDLDERLNIVYVYFFLKARTSYFLECASMGMGQPNLNTDIIGRTKIVFPTLVEQQKVVSYLEDRCGKLNSLIAEKESLINDLEAYKKSLIYEVVTGKRKVV